MKEVYELLDKLNIKYEKLEHKPVYTSEEALFITDTLKGFGVKNLFLKSKNNYYLVLIPESERANLKDIKHLIGVGEISFANDNDLDKVLKLKPGSVTPFGIINDIENKVTILIKKDLVGKDVLFHPNTNTQTIKIKYDDLIKFLDFKKHKYIVFEGERYE